MTITSSNYHSVNVITFGLAKKWFLQQIKNNLNSQESSPIYYNTCVKKTN